MKSRSTTFSRSAVATATILAAMALASCGEGAVDDGGAGPQLEDPLTLSLIDPSSTTDERIDRILALGRPGKHGGVPSLLRVLRHRSQAAFLVVGDSSRRFGYVVTEFKDSPEDRWPMERVAAIVALERIGAYTALPDLLLCLDDGNAVVRNHAARALVRLGNRAGIPSLLDNLDLRILQRETANRILVEISGEDMGFVPDAAWTERRKKTELWRSWWDRVRGSEERLALEGRPYQMGLSPEADRRIRFYTDVIGQMQFLFHEQARRTMQRMGVPALPFLREAVENGKGNPTLRAGVAQVLAAIDHPNARELLRILLADPHGTVRARAALSLGRLGGEDAARALEARLSDSDPGVAIAVLDALGRMGGPTALAAIQGADVGDDPALEEAQTLALFEASGGVQMRDAVLKMLLDVSIPVRNGAHAVLVRVLGDGVEYDAIAEEKARKASMERYRKLLGG